MSIFPATDIVSDVARAADPAKAAVAMKRLEDIGGEKMRGVGTDFALLAPSPVRARHAGPLTTIDTGASRDRVTPLSATQKFEAYLLQSWLEIILPKQDSGVYGTQAGSDVWRSMMAEQIATQITRAGGIGVHRLLDHKNSSVSVKQS